MSNEQKPQDPKPTDEAAKAAAKALAQTTLRAAKVKELLEAEGVEVARLKFNRSIDIKVNEPALGVDSSAYLKSLNIQKQGRISWRITYLVEYLAHRLIGTDDGNPNVVAFVVMISDSGCSWEPLQ